ncbi:hypothetical protein Poly51_58600 [Rubripirellula tenax]|uniref:Uncharacterized protein n=1 Tax=Rubripirellula tenax TaxID=2528015 RepID=A0A5C6E8C3_9BACT|nr:hypothetical protein Poly51_58600 [Rubripirellula tenax]
MSNSRFIGREHTIGKASKIGVPADGQVQRAFDQEHERANTAKPICRKHTDYKYQHEAQASE